MVEKRAREAVHQSKKTGPIYGQPTTAFFSLGGSNDLVKYLKELTCLNPYIPERRILHIHLNMNIVFKVH